MLGFLNPKYDPTNANVPGLFYLSDSSDNVTADRNIYFNLRMRGCPGVGNNCSDPLLVNEPARTLHSESELDNFNAHPRRGSPAIGAGSSMSGVATDYFGNKRPSSPSIGAAEPEP